MHCQLLWFTCESVLPMLCFLLDELSLQLLVLMLWCCTHNLTWVPDHSIWTWICFITPWQDYGQTEGHEILTCSTRGYRLMTKELGLNCGRTKTVLCYPWHQDQLWGLLVAYVVGTGGALPVWEVDISLSSNGVRTNAIPLFSWCA
jgi:hypothetical protein